MVIGGLTKIQAIFIQLDTYGGVVSLRLHVTDFPDLMSFPNKSEILRQIISVLCTLIFVRNW
jgi:hypothetical protein